MFKDFLLLITIGAFLCHCSGSSFKGQSASNDTPVTADAIATSSGNGDIQESVIIDQLEDAGIVDIATLEAACETATELKTLNSKLIFPERQDCSFGQNGNLERRDAFVQAQETQNQSIALEGKSIICDMSIRSEPNAQIHYDDFIFLTIANQVIFGSNSQVTNYLDRKENVYQWDFEKIKGQAINNFEAPYYCLAGVRNCVLPPHDQAGPISIRLATKDVAPIAFEVVGKSKIDANLISTGDNDDEDCFHSELDLDVEISYLPLP